MILKYYIVDFSCNKHPKSVFKEENALRLVGTDEIVLIVLNKGANINGEQNRILMVNRKMNNALSSMK